MGGLDRLIAGLMYRDLAGRRRPRRYFLAAITIFALISGIVFLGWRQREQLLSLGVRAPTVAIPTNQLVSSAPASTEVALAEAQPLATTALPAEPSFTANLPTNSSSLESCPLDPKEWEILEIAQKDNFKRITPPCVYDELVRTVAWDLLRVLGYSAPEAIEMLGFTDFPWRPVPEITGMTNTRGPMLISMSNPSPEEIKQANHPDFHAWIVDREGKPGATFTLRGCYRTETITGDQVESWGVAYPVVCVVTMDQGEWVVVELGSHHYASESLPTRRFFMYGYIGDGLWISIGYQKESFVEIRPPGSGQPAVLQLTMDLNEVIQDRKFISGLHGLNPWDSAWLEATYGLVMRPLPENWQRASDPSDYQAILDEKAKSAKERSP